MLRATKRSSRGTLGRNMRFFKLKIVALLIAMLAIAGCDNKHPLDGPAVYNDVNIRLLLVDELPDQASNVAGVTSCYLSSCTIRILKERYTECGMHELGHATHRNWHPDRPEHCRFGSTVQ